MFFAITMLMAEELSDVFAAATTVHDEYRLNYLDRLVCVGSLIGADGATIGSLCILEAESFTSAAIFVEGDPMTRSGALASIEIIEWRHSHPHPT